MKAPSKLENWLAGSVDSRTGSIPDMTILQGQEGGEAIMGGKRPKDPMFGQWIKLQMSLNTTANTTLNTTLHQSFDDQV